VPFDGFLAPPSKMKCLTRILRHIILYQQISYCYA
jgi:hypothetical protein